MPEVLTALAPRAVWGHFEALTRIPRPSGHEEAAAAYVREVAQAHGFPVESDAVGNVVVRVPGSPGHEGAPVVALQGQDAVALPRPDADVAICWDAGDGLLLEPAGEVAE